MEVWLTLMGLGLIIGVSMMIRAAMGSPALPSNDRLAASPAGLTEAALTEIDRRFAVIGTCLQRLCDSAERAHRTHVTTEALRRVLERKGLITQDELGEALAAVAAEERTLAELDPDVQAQLDELGRLTQREGA